MPATPFHSPAMIRAVKAIVSEVENPHNKIEENDRPSAEVVA